MFPWLSNISRNYETYKFQKLEVQYEAACSTNVNGLVMISIDYDPSDDAAISKTQLMANEGAVKDAPWVTFAHVSSKKNLSKQKNYYCFYEVQDASSFATIRQNDVGKLQIVSIGQTDNAPQILGSLFVDYTIELNTPQLTSSLGGSNTVFKSDTVFLGPRTGNINIEAADTNTFRFQQAFSGFCLLIQRGTGITGSPGLAAPSTDGVVYTTLENVFSTTAAMTLYRLTAPAEATIDFAPAPNTTTVLTYQNFLMADSSTLTLI